MNTALHNGQRILQNARGASLGHSTESFLVDRQAEGLARCTVKFYRQNPQPFQPIVTTTASSWRRTLLLTFLRRFFLRLSETHSPGGVHGCYRTLRAFFAGS